MPIPDQLEVYCSAKILIDRREGHGAEIHAAQRADEMLFAGDMDGELAWLTILRAIKEMQRTRRCGGERLN